MARISTGRITLFSLLLALVLFTGAFAWYAFAGDQNDDYVYLHEFINEKHFGLCDDFDLCMGDPVSTVSQVIAFPGLNSDCGTSRNPALATMCTCISRRCLSPKRCVGAA